MLMITLGMHLLLHSNALNTQPWQGALAPLPWDREAPLDSLAPHGSAPRQLYTVLTTAPSEPTHFTHTMRLLHGDMTLSAPLYLPAHVHALSGGWMANGTKRPIP